MSWKNILKAELPPQESSGDRSQNQMAMNNWAREYERRLIQSIENQSQIDTGGYTKFDIQNRQVKFGIKTVSFEEYANILKNLVRAVKYKNPNVRSNYAFDVEEYLQDTDAYVRDMQGNSTAVDVLLDYE
tara:strand:+ start:516 stop:905 length:390 start_codon:yes stop_codon:yes gene_type:complete